MNNKRPWIGPIQGKLGRTILQNKSKQEINDNDLGDLIGQADERGTPAPHMRTRGTLAPHIRR